MAYTSRTNSQLNKLGRVVLTFDKEEREIINQLSQELQLASGQIVGALVRKALGFSTSTPLLEIIMKHIRKQGKTYEKNK